MKSDNKIQQDVMEELQWEPSVENANIGVAVKDGIVTLSGFVSTYTSKLAAEEAARRVAGVRGLAEEIEVRFTRDKKLPIPKSPVVLPIFSIGARRSRIAQSM